MPKLDTLVKIFPYVVINRDIIKFTQFNVIIMTPRLESESLKSLCLFSLHTLFKPEK